MEEHDFRACLKEEGNRGGCVGEEGERKEGGEMHGWFLMIVFIPFFLCETWVLVR